MISGSRFPAITGGAHLPRSLDPKVAVSGSQPAFMGRKNRFTDGNEHRFRSVAQNGLLYNGRSQPSLSTSEIIGSITTAGWHRVEFSSVA